MIADTDYRFRLFGDQSKTVTAAYSDRTFDASRRGDFRGRRGG